MDNTNGAVVALTEWGPIQYLIRQACQRQTPETILTVHGAMGGYDQSDILGRSIGLENYRYLSVSRPGYLETPLDNQASPEDQADLFAALMDTLEIEKVIVCAISGGGYSALHFALRHPGRCRALLLCSTIGGANAVPIPFAFKVIQLAARLPFLMSYMRRRFENNIEKSLQRSVSYQDIAEEMLASPDMMTLYRELSLSTMDRMAERLPGTLNDIRITQTTEYPLEKISTPTLVIHGTDDPVVPYEEHGKKLAEQIPGARLCLAERGEHMTIFTHNGQVRKAINEFLEHL